MTASRGQSEVVGSLLLIAVVVVSVSVAGVVVLADVYDRGNSPPQLAANATAVSPSEVSLTHVGGEPALDEDLRVLVRQGATTADFDVEAVAYGDDDGRFESGETWTRSVSLTAGERVTVWLVHEPTGTVLYEGRRTA